MAGRLAPRLHHALLVGWRYLPLWARRIAIRVLYPRFPIGAVGIIRDDAGRILLVRQTYHRRERWGAPGGWLGSSETPRDTVARETLEELGIQVTVGRVLAVSAGPFGEISLAFECQIAGDPAMSLSDEIDRAAYFSPDDLPPLADYTQRLLEEAVGKVKGEK
ncbi:MAG TPA: NUDIX hydrolase [Chloroflexota bacterium]|nr:NUDIX hydrolase [Chloroflexota bacterium]